MRLGRVFAALAMAAALACCLSPAVASAARSFAFSSFEAKGSGGYRFEVISGRDGTKLPEVAITVSRGPLSTSYRAVGRQGRGFHADFGSLGQLRLAFHRRKRTVERPEKGCTIISETGSFRGSFSFTGEGGYSSIDRTSANGIVLTLPNGFCGFPDDRPTPLPLPPGTGETQLTAKAQVPHGFVEFGAAAPSDPSRSPLGEGSSFGAQLNERVGKLKITRLAQASGPPQSFELTGGRKPRGATVTPAAPFSGSASYARAAGAAPTWTGTLSVPFLGIGPTALAGEAFAVRLCPRVDLLAACAVPLPQAVP